MLILFGNKTHISLRNCTTYKTTIVETFHNLIKNHVHIYMIPTKHTPPDIRLTSCSTPNTWSYNTTANTLNLFQAKQTYNHVSLKKMINIVLRN